MSSKFSAKLATLIAAGAVIAMSSAIGLATPASADNKTKRYDERGRHYYGPSGPNAVYQQGRTRIYVSKRSWLDGGTEVNPGDRKFTDYAFPPGYSYGQQIDRLYTSRRPLGDQWDTGTPFPFPLY